MMVGRVKTKVDYNIFTAWKLVVRNGRKESRQQPSRLVQIATMTPSICVSPTNVPAVVTLSASDLLCPAAMSNSRFNKDSASVGDPALF